MSDPLKNTPLISVVVTVLAMGLSYILLFSGFKATTDLPKEVALFETRLIAGSDARPVDSVRSKVGTLRFSSGIEQQIKAAEKKWYPGKVVSKGKIDVDTLLFHYNPHLLVWGVTIVILISFAAGSVPFAISKSMTVFRYLSADWYDILSVIVGLIVMGVVLAFAPKWLSNLSYYTFWTPFLDVIFKDHGTMGRVIYVALALLSPALVGIALLFPVGKRLGSRLAKGDAEAIQHFKQYFHLIRTSLDFFLIVLTVAITLTVLATGAFRQALLTAVIVEGLDLVPVEFVYLYGVFFTVVLVLFYAPVHFQLEALKSIATEKPPLRGVERELKVSNWHSFKILASLFAPLLSSILPGLTL